MEHTLAQILNVDTYMIAVRQSFLKTVEPFLQKTWYPVVPSKGFKMLRGEVLASHKMEMSSSALGGAVRLLLRPIVWFD